MKMSKVFELPLNADFDTVSDGKNEGLATFNRVIEDEAAAHAINQHDPLVKALTGLLKAYEGLEGHQTAQGSWHSHAKAVLAEEEQR